MIKRLFVKLPLYVLFFATLLTCIMPLGYWVVTGNSYYNIFKKIDDI